MNTNMKRTANPAAFLAALRARGWSTPQMATAAGISANYAFMLRSGYVPGAETRARVAGALGVDEALLWPPANSGEGA